MPYTNDLVPFSHPIAPEAAFPGCLVLLLCKKCSSLLSSVAILGVAVVIIRRRSSGSGRSEHREYKKIRRNYDKEHPTGGALISSGIERNILNQSKAYSVVKKC